ncbi:DUF3971 domain-containing protein [Pseudorhodobacter sp. E13]|uniref:YhdP family protein n=1 Tax=Pseudorhodobacter sp. E13 TaxID=2487931 RepID=UPI001F456F67|nr:DUF3971 domain-containing protein [Pseudorhodobacter sp. E13]
MADPTKDHTESGSGDQATAPARATEVAPTEGAQTEAVDHSPIFIDLPDNPPPDLTDPDNPEFLEGENAFNGPEAPHHHPTKDAARPKPHRLARRRKPVRRGSFWLMPTVIFLSLAMLFAALALSGKPLRLPVWAVVEAEARINDVVGEIAGPGTALSLGGAVFVVDEDWVPRLRLEDVRILQPDGTSLLSVPEMRVALDPSAVAQGQLRLRSLRVIGANMGLRRLADGRFDLALTRGIQPRPVEGLSGLIGSAVTLFEQPALSHLRLIEAQALTLTVQDDLLGRVWQLGDGRMQLSNREDALAMELGVSVTGGQTAAASAVMTLIAAKEDASARMTVTVDRVAAADIAAQAAPLAWLGVLDAPISGQIASTLDRLGALSGLEASLTIDQGALRPTPQTAPVAFDGASLFFSFDPARERLDVSEWTVRSADVTLSASGHAYLPGVTAGRPSEVLAQIQVNSLQLDPQGVLEEPVTFEQGALDFRVRLAPFGIDIGQITLLHQGQRLQASGQVEPEAGGWSVAVNADLDQIAHDRLLALWPAGVVGKTRIWVADNVHEGLLTNVRAGFRLRPGQEPLFSLGYDYSGADVRFLKTLPPIQNGRGYAVVAGKSYKMVLEAGQVAAPSGGLVDIAGSVFSVVDVTEKPARAEIGVKAKGDMSAALSLLDEPPFQFMTKAKLPTDLGQGQVEASADLRLPLKKGNKIADVDFDVTGVITGFRSDRLVPGRELRADRLALRVTPEKLEISGKGALQSVPFDVTYAKQFAPEFKGKSTITGTAELSAKAASNMGVSLPDGLLAGRGVANITVDLQQGQAPKLVLRSSLAGVQMAIPSLGWSKGSASTGRLALDLTLGKPARVDSVVLEAAGLKATGSISLAADGGLELARFTSVTLGGWLNARAELRGRGKGRPPAVAVTGGRVDMRGLPGARGGAGSSSGPISLALDQLTVTDGLALTGFRSTITPGRGGVSGDFTGRVNGQTPIKGSLAPSANGTAVRLRSEDAGSVFSAAKVFPNAQGGSMDLILRPTGAKGTYDGNLTMQGIRIRKAPALAELINAISVVGLLEQMNGSGLLFNEVEAQFRLSPRAVQIGRASAVGASLGVSASGLYVLQGGRLDVQGVISPIYLLNGIGAFLTRKGEGLFGFNYTVKGTAKEPSVSVNPLSLFTPGMFREIFRSAPPQLDPNE